MGNDLYKVKVQSHFSSAHNLRKYKGKCEDLHGHNWRVEIIAESQELDEIGMVVDFKDLKGALNEVMSELDHKYLNDIDYFKESNPTSENIAKYIYGKISKDNPGLPVKKVTVWETETSCATYSKN